MLPSVRVLRAAPVAALLLASPLAAQGAPEKPQPVPTVEVVATRIPHSPDEVAASIEVLSGDNLRAHGATTLREALTLATGVSVAPGGDAGPASAVPEFWGLREFDAFLLVVDNIPWGGAFNPAISALSMRDVERIEVLRGPAPVTFGATSFVGVIHVVHRSAASQSRTVTVTGATFGGGSIATDLGLPSVAGFTSRLSADFDKEGFKDDRTAYSRGHANWRGMRDVGTNKVWLGADLNILRQDPSTPHVREGAALSTQTPLDANYNPAGSRLDENRFTLSGGFERPLASGTVWTTIASFTHSGQEVFRGFLVDVSNTPDNASGFREDIEVNDFYGDTHLVFPAKRNIRLMVGADVLAAGGEAKGAAFDYTAPLAATSAPVVAEPTTFDLDAGSDRFFVGAYGSADWQVSPRLALSGGARLNMTSESRGEGEKVTHSRMSGSVGAIYGLWENGGDHLRVFANARSTFKPAAFDFSLAENEGVLDPETSFSYEGGVKFRTMAGRLDVEASGFNMDFENLVTSTVVGGLPSLQNAGTTRFSGYELATSIVLASALSARATYSGHDGKFVDFVQDFGGVNTQLAGKRFEMSAKQLWSAGLSYSPATGFFANASANHTGDRYLNKRNTALAEPFTTIDAGAGFRMDRWEFRVDGRNLGDRRDPVSESEFGDAQYYRMTARTIRAGVTVRY